MLSKDRIFDAYLVSRTQAGDRTALDRLVRHRSGRLLAHATRLLGEPEGARDVVQDAWAEILRALPTLQDGHAFLPWALRITSRRVARVIRGRVRDRNLTTAYAAEARVAADPGPGADGPAETRDIAKALAVLPPAHRATVALFYLEDLGVAEVAQALDVPVGTVKTRLMHARRILRAYLEGPEHEQT